MADPELVASRNFHVLGGNVYPGRGLIVGRDTSGENLVEVYWLMGRSSNSRNRLIRQDGTRLYTDFADPSKGGDPSLVIYNVMREELSYFVVSNGDQTDTVIDALERGYDFEVALSYRTYEPDAPNFTPRITAMCSMQNDRPVAKISVLRRSPWGYREQHTFTYDNIAPGFGYGVHTYQGDGNPLPAWQGEPLLLPLVGTPADIARAYWNILNEANRVSIAVRFINEKGESHTEIINSHI